MQTMAEAGTRVAGSAVKARLRERIGREIEVLTSRLAETHENGKRRPSNRSRMQGRARWFGQLLAGLSDGQELHLDPDAVGFGSTVIATDLDSARRVSFTVMSGSSMDVAEDQVSLESPIGRALTGRRAGDEVIVQTPGGVRHFRIESVKTLVERFGLHRSVERGGERP